MSERTCTGRGSLIIALCGCLAAPIVADAAQPATPQVVDAEASSPRGGVPLSVDATASGPGPEATSIGGGAAGATSLSGNRSTRCAELRRAYLSSQACFAPYRLANGGLRKEAFKHCQQVLDPSLECGRPDLPAK